MTQNRFDLAYPCNDCFAERGQPCTKNGGNPCDEVHPARTNVMDKTEAHIVHELGVRFGFGRIMQLASDLWGKLLRNEGIDSADQLSVGPCVESLAPCVCIDLKNPGTCNWCCGSYRITEAVRKLIENQPIRRFIQGKDSFWNPLGDDENAYPAHRYYPAAVLHGLRPGAIIAIYQPENGPAYEPDEDAPE